MKRLVVILAISCTLFITGCATEYKAYEGRNTVIQGNGGTKTIVEGIEIWENGDPPRSYQVVGIIDDSRPGSLIAEAMQNRDIVNKAKEYGGDAVIKLRSDSEITGFYTSSTGRANIHGNTISGYGSSFTMPAQRNYTKYAVIKYVK